MEPDVPLSVPEVNRHDLADHIGIIANPNCSTIQMVVALKPLHDRARIRRIVVTTFQSVSGTGKDAMDELMTECQDLLSFREATPKVYPYQIAFNCLPQIDEFLPTGYTKEEMKMLHETRKIIGRSNHPSDGDHGPESPCTSGILRRSILKPSKNCPPTKPGRFSPKRPACSFGDPAQKIYPMPLDVAGKDEVYVGRVREDDRSPTG